MLQPANRSSSSSENSDDDDDQSSAFSSSDAKHADDGRLMVTNYSSKPHAHADMQSVPVPASGNENESSSSSSDDDSSSTSNDDDDSQSEPTVEKVRRNKAKGEDDSDADPSTASSPSPSSADSGSDDDDDDDNDDDESDDAGQEDESSMPLAERIRRQEQRGIARDARRQMEKNSRAVAVASQHLAKFRNDKMTKNASNATTTTCSKQQQQQQQQSVKPTTSKQTKRKSKHAPTEVSSKRSEFYQRQNRQKAGSAVLNESGLGIDLGAHRYKPRDPRMQNMTGHFNVEHFERNYAFLQDMRQQEIAVLKKRIAAWKTAGRKGQKKRRELGLTTDASASLEQDQQALKRLLQEKADYERNQMDRTAKRAVKKTLQEQVASGQRGVYFPKRRELKRMQMEAKFEELRKRGGDQAVDKAVAKRRKKNKTRDAGMLRR